MHKIELRRIELGFSVADVAILTGLSQGTIYRIESENPDGYRVRLDTAQAIAYGLDSQLHTLFDGEELSHLGRPAHTGRPIVDIQTKRKTGQRCPECNVISSHKELEQGRSECHNMALGAT